VSYQRRRGAVIKIWKSATVVDNRGNETLVADADGPYEVRAAAWAQRSARAEVPGQAEINIVRLMVPADLDDVTLWSRVEYLGIYWDIASPPALHLGTRKTRHWSIDIRKRPS
jgi:hypothetical protein